MAMKRVEQQAKPTEATVEMFAEALTDGIKMAEEKREQDTSDGRRYDDVPCNVCTCTCTFAYITACTYTCTSTYSVHMYMYIRSHVHV